MSNGINGTARDGRLPSIRLHPVKDGVLGFGEVRVTATQRDRLATEQAKLAKESVLAFGMPERSDSGRFVQKAGKIARNVRTLDDEENILPTCAKVTPAARPHDSHPARTTRKGPTLAAVDQAIGEARTSQPRDYTEHDAIIRESGYKGEITSAMRKVAGDVIAFRKSLL